MNEEETATAAMYADLIFVRNSGGHMVMASIPPAAAIMSFSLVATDILRYAGVMSSESWAPANLFAFAGAVLCGSGLGYNVARLAQKAMNDVNDTHTIVPGDRLRVGKLIAGHFKDKLTLCAGEGLAGAGGVASLYGLLSSTGAGSAVGMLAALATCVGLGYRNAWRLDPMDVVHKLEIAIRPPEPDRWQRNEPIL